jgi:hypothetical protein
MSGLQRIHSDGRGRGFYCEAHHIRPLGIPHNGADSSDNILIVCPNHHKTLDYGAMMIDLSRLVLLKHEIPNQIFGTITKSSTPSRSPVRNGGQYQSSGKGWYVFRIARVNGSRARQDFHSGEIERLTVGADVALKFLMATNRFAAQDSEWKFPTQNRRKLAARSLSSGSTRFIRGSGMC